MRSSRRILLLMFAFVLTGFLGYGLGIYQSPTYQILQLRFLDGQSEAHLFVDPFDQTSDTGMFRLGALSKAMKNAKWTNEEFMRKGNWVLQFRDGQRVCMSYYGAFFWVAGTPGYYLIPDADHLAIQPEYGRIMEQVIAFRHKHIPPNHNDAEKMRVRC